MWFHGSQAEASISDQAAFRHRSRMLYCRREKGDRARQARRLVQDSELRFSPFVTKLAFLVLLAGMLLLAWLQVTVPRLDRVTQPEQALAWIIGREMDMEAALAREPEWARTLFEWLSSDSESERKLAITWYEELAAYSSWPTVQLELAILEAEDGRLEQVRRKAEAWAASPDPLPSFARLLKIGYWGGKQDQVGGEALQAASAEALPAGWFADRLAGHLAASSGDRAWSSAVDEALAERGKRILHRSYGLAIVQLVWVFIGAMAALFLLSRRQEQSAWRIGGAQIPPPWKGRVGMLVLVRGGAVGIVVMLAFILLESENLLVRLLSIPLSNLPLLLLARRYLMNRDGPGFVEWLGLRPLPGAWRPLSLVVVAALAVGFLVEWGLGKVAEPLDLSSHWTEWFDEDLIWGGAPVVAVSLVEYVLFAPLFEELVFRGLLFATLRRRFGFWLSATLSAAIFALAHGYGLLGFASVIFSGLLWAWVYEKTGSLLPGMAAHALNNLMVCLTEMWLLR